MPTLEQLRDLAERLAKATGPDRELDRDVGLMLAGWKEVDHPQFGKMLSVDGDLYVDDPRSLHPAPTESIDAALALVERMPGWRWALTDRGDRKMAAVWLPSPISRGLPAIKHHYAPTAPLALLKALVAALIAREEGNA